MGSAAFGLAWGWLIGLWTAPAGARARSTRPAPGAGGILFRRLPPALRRRLERPVRWWQRLARSERWPGIARWARRGLLLLLFLAPAVEVWAYGGAGATILWLGMGATGLWLHRAWREYLANEVAE